MRSLRRHARTARLFIFDLVTISVGLLIALGIDSLVERRQERRLAANAEQALRLEIQKNAATLDEALSELLVAKQLMQASLDSISLLLTPGAARTSKSFSLKLKVSSFDQPDTSWKSAQATRAIDFMPYEQVERYNTLYSGQADLLEDQRAVFEDFVQAVALVKRFNLGAKPKVTPEQAALLAERFGAWQMHIVILYNKARVVSNYQHAFLEGKAIANFQVKDSLDGIEISADN